MPKMQSRKISKFCRGKGDIVILNQMYAKKIDIYMPLTCDNAYKCKIKNCLYTTVYPCPDNDRIDYTE